MQLQNLINLLRSINTNCDWVLVPRDKKAVVLLFDHLHEYKLVLAGPWEFSIEPQYVVIEQDASYHIEKMVTFTEDYLVNLTFT